MNRFLASIEELHKHYKITPEDVPWAEGEKEFRVAAMREEIDEFIEAETPADELDALVDLVVFAFGTAERLGILKYFELAFDVVMEANMKKEVGATDKRGGFKLDLRKPEGWKAPDIEQVMKITDNLCKVLDNRGGIYGTFEDNTNMTQNLYNLVTSTDSAKQWSNQHKEAFHMVCHKLARAVCGDPGHSDNFVDLAGYSMLLSDSVDTKNDSGD